MASLNKIILIGNVGSEPEMRFTPNGKAVTGFSLAVNHTFTTPEGEKREEATWFKVTCWDRLAENVNQFLSKGRQAYVEGRVQLKTWEGEDGQPRSNLEVNASQVLFLGKREESAGATDSPAPSEAELEDLPF